MNNTDVQQRIQAGYQLFMHPGISRDTFESVRTLLKGINPELDKKLSVCADALSTLEKVQKGDFINLTAENLPEDTEEEKSRKRGLLLFLRTWRDLQAEVERVKTELYRYDKNLEHSAKNQTFDEKVFHYAKIIKSAKGVFGIVTIAAVVIVGVTFYIQSNTADKNASVRGASSQNNPTRQRIQVIDFEGKKIPLNNLIIGTGPDCDSDHYHAIDHKSAKATDGTTILDPGGCGYGKVREVEILYE